jgi:large subunit ribosomal protein L4
MAILSKFIDKEAIVIDDLSLTAPKTKEIIGLLKAIKVGKKTTESGEKDITLLDGSVLIGTNGIDANVYKSARNIDGVKVLPAAEFNCFTVLKQKRLLITKSALEALTNPPAKPTPATPTEEKAIVRRGRAARIKKQKLTAARH